MKVSYKWLGQLVDLAGLTPEEVANKLTFAGAEVEGISYPASGTNLVIGEIISCVPHPDSDHLHLLKVDEGEEFGVHQIVCGAPNAREGLRVIVARVGAKLPAIEIKPARIRGVDSDGMCCSLLELGVERKMLSEAQVAGIEELPADAPVGCTDVLGYLGLDDAILDVSVLPNRPDLNAMENVAKEVACLFSRELITQKKEKEKLVEIPFKVGSETPKCPQFSARVYKNVKNGPSPKWLKNILNAEGIRSIDAIVDIGNYVMLLTGQPLNMYDADKLAKQELVVIDDYEGEFLAMDGNAYNLVKGDLLVTSDRVPVCLAGIMTADGARIDSSTKNIVVEAANFDYASIRRTSNRIGLASDSSSRFCKGINPHQAEYVQSVTGELLRDLCGAEVCSKTVNYDTLSHKPKRIEVSLDYINSRLGTHFSFEQVKEVLLRDHFEIEFHLAGNFILLVPPYRIDIEGKADITEEVIRLLGYENVISSLPITSLACNGLTKAQQKQREVRHYLLSMGISESLTYTLVSREEEKTFRHLHQAEPYILANPLTVEREVVRTHLLPSLVNVLTYNVNHQNKDVAFFEISDIDAIDVSTRHLAIALTGSLQEQGQLRRHQADFYDVKGLYEGILQILGLKPNRFQVRRFPDDNAELHPGKSAEIMMGKKRIGYFGELHPLALAKYDLPNCAVLELDIAELFALRVSEIKAREISRFPLVTRDLAFLIDETVAWADIEKEVMKSDKLVRKVEVFDIYRGTNLPEGKVSMAISVSLGSNEKTLVEAEINNAMKAVIDNLSRKFLAEIRG